MKRIKQLASAQGLVGYRDAPETSEFLVIEWHGSLERYTLVERFPYSSPTDKLACVHMVRGFVDTYAEMN